MIDKEEFEKASFEENQKFIKKILKLATHNAFTKDDLLLLIKWQDEIIEKMQCCKNCKKYRMLESQVPLSCLKNRIINSCCEEWKMKGDKFEPIMIAVAETELQRFRKIETENTLLKVQIEGLEKENEKMKNHTNCKFYHEWNLANVMEEPLDDLSPCQGCKNFSLWELAE